MLCGTIHLRRRQNFSLFDPSLPSQLSHYAKKLAIVNICIPETPTPIESANVGNGATKMLMLYYVLLYERLLPFLKICRNSD